MHVSQISIGVLFASFATASFVGAPIVGVLTDRFGRKIPMIAGLFLLAGSTLMYAISVKFWLLLIARILQGFASAVTWTASMASVGDAFTPETQGAAYSKLLTLSGLGSMVGPLIGGFFVKISGGNKAFPFFIMIIFIVIDFIARIF